MMFPGQHVESRPKEGLQGLWLIGMALAVSAGILSAFGNLLIALVISSLILSACLVVYYVQTWPFSVKANADWILWLAFAVTMVSITVFKVTGRDVSYMVELCLLSAAPFVVSGSFRWLRASRQARMWSLIMLLFLVVSLVSSILGRSKPLAAIFQLITNAKFIFMIVLGYCLAWSVRTEKAFWGLVKWSWLPIGLIVAWQWGYPQSYFKLYNHELVEPPNPISFFPTKALGPFQHASYLANYVSICLLALFAGRKYINLGVGVLIFIASAYLFLLIASGERQELMSVAAAVIIGSISRFKGLSFGLATIAGLFLFSALSAALFSLFESQITKEIWQWGVSGYVRDLHPRSALYQYSILVANQYFPLGSGLGTYGGAGAAKFDHSLYAELGFARFWWFEKENFLMDTFWPAYIAETGWIGFALFFGALLALVISSYRSMRDAIDEKCRTYCSLAFCAMFYFFLLTFSSPAIQDPGLFLIPAAIFGVSVRQFTARSKNVEA